MAHKKGKLFIFSAPSGSGKSTIIRHLIAMPELRLELSISATTRPPRGEEKHGVEYYFISADEFKHAIEQDLFAEYQEVYEGRFYGTLKSELERIMDKGNNVALDIDVLGGINVKKLYGDRALSMFIMPPSLEELERRLVSRNTDSAQDIANRLAKAEYELSFAECFDVQIINDDLTLAVEQARDSIMQFMNS